MNIILTDTTHVDELSEEIGVLLEFMGYPEALVTDETTFNDFYDDSLESVDQLMELNDCLGVKAGLKSKLWSVANTMRQQYED